MRYWRLGLIVAVSVVLQLGLLAPMRPLGVVPNLLLGLVVLVGLSGSATAALAVAIICGLILDIVSGADFGLRTGLFAMVALVAGMTHRAGFDTRGLLVPMALVMAATVVQALVVMAGLIGSTIGWSPGAVLGRLGIELVLNLGLVALLKPLLNRAVMQEPTMSVIE